MNRILNRSSELTIANAILDAADELGYAPDELVPGLLMAVWLLAEQTPDSSMVIDEAIDLLNDGPGAEYFDA